MQQFGTEPTPASSAPVLSDCPQCDGRLVVLRIIPGRAETEYWTMRCTACGAIHLDIVKLSPPPLTG